MAESKDPIQDGPKLETFCAEELGIAVSPFDNDITLLYKWSERTGVPISLIIVQSRNQDNYHLPGSKNYVFTTDYHSSLRDTNKHS